MYGGDRTTRDESELARLFIRRTAALTGGDRDLVHQFVHDQIGAMKEQGVDQAPILLARLYDMAGCLRDVLRFEDAFHQDAAPEGYEVLGKARDRFRKAMKEFEDSALRFGAPAGRGLADAVRPLLKKAEGALDAALRRSDPGLRRKGSRRKAAADKAAGHIREPDTPEPDETPAVGATG